MSRSHRNILLAVAVLLVFGALRFPYENALQRRLVESRFRQSEMDLQLHDDIGTASMALALGGFRSLVATFLDFDAYDHAQKDEYDRVDFVYQWIHKLQPDSYHYWDWAHWQAAYNAASHIQYKRDSDKEENRVGWEEDYMRWVERGREILEAAMVRLPDDDRLPALMAELYRRRYLEPDHCKAAEYYLKASEDPDGPSYYKRFHIYQLAQCPGREQEAYDALKELYDSAIRFPSVLTHLRNLEEKLNIPAGDRIPEPEVKKE